MAVRGDSSEDDDGLAALSGMGVLDRETSLVVVTGNPPPEQLHAVSRVRSRYSAVRLISVGADDEPVRAGVPVISAGTSEEFATVWNRTVRR